jgi:single-strand DNA-binding protein
MEYNNVILKWVYPTTKVSDDFRKRDIVVESVEKYPQLIKIELQNDRCEIIDNFQLGDLINLKIELRGRKWTSPEGKTMLLQSIVGYSVKPHTPPKVVQKPIPVEESEDLPF